jgi:hypothetical protein
MRWAALRVYPPCRFAWEATLPQRFPDPRNLISTPKCKASSRPVFAVAPVRLGKSTDPPSRLEISPTRVKTSTAETGEDDVLTDAAPPQQSLANSCPSDGLHPPFLRAHINLSAARTTSRAKTTRTCTPATTPVPRACNHKPSVPSPRVAARRLVLLASTWQATLSLVCVSRPAKRPCVQRSSTGSISWTSQADWWLCPCPSCLCRPAEFASPRLTWLGNCPRFCFVQSSA